MKQIAKIVESIGTLSLIELSELKCALEHKFGVYQTAAPTVPMPSRETVVEEQTAFDLVLTSVGLKKIEVIKIVRVITNLGLKESKALVESAPVAVLENASKSEAEKFQKEFEAVGAIVELK